MKSLFLLLVLIFSGYTIKAQHTHREFKDVWLSMLNVDDNEKNFRFTSFADSLQLMANAIDETSINDYLPNQWSYHKSEDESIIVLSGVLPYRLQNNVLLYLIKADENDFVIFHAPINFKSEETIVPEIGLHTKIRNSISATSLKISFLNNQFTHIPDIKIKLLLSQLSRSRDDGQKEELSEYIWNRLEVLLEDDTLFADDFKGFERISTLLSPDRKVKICTWNVEYFNGDNSFSGGVAISNGNGVAVHRLIDSYHLIEHPEDALLTPDQWFGAVYYDIIENKHNEHTFYTLLGYNAHNAFTKIRVVDVLTIGKEGKPYFGSALFDSGNGLKKRKIYEYSIRANMMLRYDTKLNMIVMDNLASFDPAYSDDARYIGPDFTHNGFRFENGRWIYFDEIDLRNPAPNRRRN